MRVQVEVTHLSHEVNPFNGKPFFNEVAFCHTPSRTLMTADFFWNYPSTGVSGRTRAWKFGMDAIFAPFYFNLMIKDTGVLCPFQPSLAVVYACAVSPGPLRFRRCKLQVHWLSEVCYV